MIDKIVVYNSGNNLGILYSSFYTVSNEIPILGDCHSGDQLNLRHFELVKNGLPVQNLGVGSKIGHLG